MPPATQIKKGNVIILDGQLYRILTLTHITPGKGNAVVQTDIRNIMTGVKTNKRFRSAEEVETAEVRTRKMQYLYSDADVYHFMDQETFEQFELNEDLLSDAIHYIVAESVYDISVYDDKPIGIDLPQKMILQIAECDPAQKGIQGKTKPAVTDTGLIIKVPLFIEQGEKVVVSTETNDYMERAKS